MGKTLQWIIGICVVILTLAIAATMIAPLFVPQLRGVVMTGPMMGGLGPGHMFGGRGMMGGLGEFRMPFFGIGMFLLPLLFVGLIVLGVVWFVRAVSARPAVAAAPNVPQPPAPQPSATVACAHCGQPLQANWKACPYCGEKVQ